MANLSTERFTRKRNLFSLIAFIFATIASTEAARQETMQRYMEPTSQGSVTAFKASVIGFTSDSKELALQSGKR